MGLSLCCGLPIDSSSALHGLQEEEKATRKKSKHKKSKATEEGKEDRKKRRKPPRSKEQKAADELEAFLGGGAPGSRHPGGGDYEEL